MPSGHAAAPTEPLDAAPERRPTALRLPVLREGGGGYWSFTQSTLPMRFHDIALSGTSQT
jgi:hypothetical protein